ncbi:MAG: AraC family transcriptional regulator [Oscillospiraceae bacterium]|jgi:AraC-like DNA-binding protein|nr:AraC family transcriptional regulator [Oscillospiraceae bacterium]
MEKIIFTDKNQMEIKASHGTLAFPFHVHPEKILNYKGQQFDCHWHKEMELTLICDGGMGYKANDREYFLTAGDCLFINSNVLHMGWSVERQNCSYYAVTVNPTMFGRDDSAVMQKYVTPVLNSNMLSSYLFRKEIDWQKNIIDAVKKMEMIYRQKAICYEIVIVGLLMEIWGLFCQNIESVLQTNDMTPKSVGHIKNVLSYIFANYDTKITLADMAAAANISKSECSHAFKRFMRETPFEYLLRYRVEKSLPALMDPTQSITTAALSVGFSSASYYAEIFKRCMGMTPREYRKQEALDG